MDKQGSYLGPLGVLSTGLCWAQKLGMTMTDPLAFKCEDSIPQSQGSGAGLGSALIYCVTLGSHWPVLSSPHLPKQQLEEAK